jgi:hypothetical protein
MATGIKYVYAITSIYRDETNAGILKKYMTDSIAMGSVAALFKDPNILAAYYGTGTLAANAIGTAQTAYSLAPTKGNLGTVKDKMALGVKWLDGYVGQVEVISNSDTNRTTELEAETNIKNSFLTPFKMVSGSKGSPADPHITGENIGTGIIDINVINGINYKPTRMTFVAVELPPVVEPPIADPIVTLENGQLSIEFFGPGKVIIQSSSGKGKFTKFTSLVAGGYYNIVAFAQNAKTKLSGLSNILNLRG